MATGNYGHFTAARVERGRVRGLAPHLERLTGDCDALFGTPLDAERVRASMRRVAAQLSGAAMLRVTVFGPPTPGARPRILVGARGLTPGGPAGLAVRTVDWVRDLPAVKHVGLFGQFHQRLAAQRTGFDDALFVTPAGRIAEGPTWNFAGVIDGRLVWPDDACLPGVTRRLLQGLHTEQGLRWATRPIRREDLPGLQAAYATSAGIGLRPIARIDGVHLPAADPLLDELTAGYAALPWDEL